MCSDRIYLSPPHLGDAEFALVREAFATNWIAPVGPHVDAFEQEFAQKVGVRHAVALSSGTAALHLSLRMLGVGRGDEVFCSDLTFAASANPIIYEGAAPVFIDSDRTSWNIDTELLAEALRDRAKKGRLPKAVVAVHLYGQCANLDRVVELCGEYQVPLIEDAAEALGARYLGRGGPISPGTRGWTGFFSFNGNKIITTSGGGMLVTNEAKIADQARFLSTQARDPAPHYEHSQIGFNYRLSNVLAGIGRGQLQVLDQRVDARRRIFEIYREQLGGMPGIEFMPEAAYSRSTRWLTCVLITPEAFGADREQVRVALAAENIEARPVWKPMHLQPVFAGCECYGGMVGEDLFERGLCLPSGSSLSREDQERVIDVVRRCARQEKIGAVC